MKTAVEIHKAFSGCSLKIDEDGHYAAIVDPFGQYVGNIAFDDAGDDTVGEIFMSGGFLFRLDGRSLHLHGDNEELIKAVKPNVYKAMNAAHDVLSSVHDEELHEKLWSEDDFASFIQSKIDLLQSALDQLKQK